MRWDVISGPSYICRRLKICLLSRYVSLLNSFGSHGLSGTLNQMLVNAGFIGNMMSQPWAVLGPSAISFKDSLYSRKVQLKQKCFSHKKKRYLHTHHFWPKMSSSNAVPSLSEPISQNRTMKTLFVLKLVFLGMLLPAFDLGTDLLTIYQHWTSSQWVLNYVAYGLIMSLIGHNVVSTLYCRRNWSKSENEAKGFRSTSPWKILRIFSFCFGVGNMQVTIELIMDLAGSKLGQTRWVVFRKYFIFTTSTTSTVMNIGDDLLKLFRCNHVLVGGAGKDCVLIEN